MGLASKMAVAGAGAGSAYMAGQSGPGGPGYGAQGGYPPQQGAYPGQQQAPGKPPYPSQGAPGQQYQAYPGGNNQQGPPQGQYGAPPPQQGYGNQSYGASAPGFQARDTSAYRNNLMQGLADKGLNPSMFPRLNIDAVAQSCPAVCGQLSAEWKVEAELVHDLARLALYDIIIFVDNSGSMRFEENGERIKDLHLILSRVSSAATKFDANGISLRIMNQVPGLGQTQLDGIKQPQQIEQLLGRPGQEGLVKFSGLTPLGTELRRQVIDPMIIQPIRSRALEKPVLVIVITDGQPAGEARETLRNGIQAAVDASRQAYNGGVAASFQIAQVGNDEPARKFLGELDKDQVVGPMVDVTSNYEAESTEFQQKSGIYMSPELWLLKLLLGAVDSQYDSKDESAKNTPAPQYGQQNYFPQGGQGAGYNRPPPNAQYPQQGSQYPPQQGGYGGQSNYSGQQGGGYPGQQQYGAPQGGYGGQQGYGQGQGQQGQGGYGGAPPQPPRY